MPWWHSDHHYWWIGKEWSSKLTMCVVAIIACKVVSSVRWSKMLLIIAKFRPMRLIVMVVEVKSVTIELELLN